VFVNGSQKDRLPNTSHLSFEGISSSALIARLPDLAIAAGSACTSAVPGPSHVLTAMGLEDSLIKGSIRFSLGKQTTEEETEIAIRKIKAAVIGLRNTRSQ
jgi:cysteine desulfurase